MSHEEMSPEVKGYVTKRMADASEDCVVDLGVEKVKVAQEVLGKLGADLYNTTRGIHSNPQADAIVLEMVLILNQIEDALATAVSNTTAPEKKSSEESGN